MHVLHFFSEYGSLSVEKLKFISEVSPFKPALNFSDRWSQPMLQFCSLMEKGFWHQREASQQPAIALDREGIVHQAVEGGGGLWGRCSGSI